MTVSAQGPQLRTARLLLRRWREADLPPFAAMNADPEVMEHYPARLTRAESDAFARRIEEGFGEAGFGLWAVETIADGGFIGYTGLARPRFTAPFTSPARPATEIGWRLARHAWGHGYATEAARAALGFAFGQAGLREIVSFTAVTNIRSQAVMRRIGMTRDPSGDFDHPALPPGHRLRQHVLYRMARQDWHPGSQMILGPLGLCRLGRPLAPGNKDEQPVKAARSASKTRPLGGDETHPAAERRQPRVARARPFAVIMAIAQVAGRCRRPPAPIRGCGPLPRGGRPGR